jgi:glycosyltransferase involved in cell wall biosynthesis
MKLTSIITTKDEALHVGRCIDSVKGLGPVIVVDSGSEDNTVAIAHDHGALVISHAWVGYADQKNWALANLPIETEWVLFLDADEQLTEEGRSEIVEAIKGEDVNGYFIARENIVFGRRLRHAWWYPDYQMRVFRRGCARYEDRLVHEHVLIEGTTAHLRHPLIHENLKGVGEWMSRHVRYAYLEAQEIQKAKRLQDAGGVSASFRGSRAERRRALKTRVWYRMPLRPAIRFFWMYVVKRGFLDGRAGLAYCQLVAAYESLIDANVLELELELDQADSQRPQALEHSWE